MMIKQGFADDGGQKVAQDERSKQFGRKMLPNCEQRTQLPLRPCTFWRS